MSFFRNSCLSLLLMGTLLFSTHAHSTYISPARVFIDANQSTGEMIIMNRKDETMIYNFLWQSRAMDDDRSVHEDEAAEQISDYMPLQDYVVYSPRQAIIGPGETQRIRFFVRRRANMKDGEYRSHILIGGKPTKEKEIEQLQNTGGIIPIVARVGIPVMVRHGQTKIDMEMTKMEFEKKDGRDVLVFEALNNSTRSIYVEPFIFCTLPGEDKPTTHTLLPMRAYYETLNVKGLAYVPQDLDLDACESVRVEMRGSGDFEYARKPFFEKVMK